MSDVAAAVRMDEATRDALVAYLLAYADDELVLGHRDSEWTGIAPALEEDVAFSSIAQDEIGHATLLYGVLADLLAVDADHLALRRPVDAYRHAMLLERENGDWAFTIARQYLYDLTDLVRLQALCRSSYPPLAAIAGKIVREEQYHLMHGRAWWDRLANGTAESRDRLIRAARSLAPLALDVLGATPGQALLLASEFVPVSMDCLAGQWREEAEPLLTRLYGEEPRFALPSPRQAREPSDAFRALHAELTMVSASGLGDRW